MVPDESLDVEDPLPLAMADDSATFCLGTSTGLEGDESEYGSGSSAFGRPY